MLATAGSTQILPPRVALAASLVGFVGVLRPLPWPVLAVAAAPLWLQAGGVSGALGPSAAPAGGAGAVVLCLALALLGRGEGRALRGLILGVGLVEALRAWLVAGEAPLGERVVGPLIVGTVLVAGASAAPRRRRRAVAVALALSAGTHLLRARPALATAPDSAREVRERLRLGLLDRHLQTLVERPALGLAAVAAAPTRARPAVDLLDMVGPGRLVDVGWTPLDAPLGPADRRAVALALDRRGRGGAALRLLHRGRADPAVAWTWLLLARDQGAAASLDVSRGAARPAPPPGTPRLPGSLRLDWAFLRDGARVLDLHLDAPVEALRLHLRGQSYQGPARLRVWIDAGPEWTLSLPDDADGVLPLPGPFSAGPHRLHVVFDNDRDDAGGDRNAWVLGISTP